MWKDAGQENIMNKKVKSTYEEHIESLTPQEKEEFDQGYRDHLLSELLIALMNQDGISVRRLAKADGISPSLIQGIRSGEKENITMKSFLRIIKALGSTVVVKKDGNYFPIELTKSTKK